MEEIVESVLFRWFLGMNLDQTGMGCNQLQQEPGAAAGWGRGTAVSLRDRKASPRKGVGFR